jgi:hypothetical protein
MVAIADESESNVANHFELRDLSIPWNRMIRVTFDETLLIIVSKSLWAAAHECRRTIFSIRRYSH